MLTTPYKVYDSHIATFSLTPRWIEAGLPEINWRELNKVRAFYTHKHDFGYEGASGGPEGDREDSFLLHKHCFFNGRRYDVSLFYDGVKTWDASIVEPIKHARDASKAVSLIPVLENELKDYFRVGECLQTRLALLG